jgi:cellulose synthase/poly-beta-1,6-N-acetylglucosamine synthase-like glycosyltransferase
VSVSLVIPGRNCARTLDACLEAAVAVRRRPGSPLTEIVFVDDGSTDDTAAIAGRHDVTVIAGEGRGPGAARNLGWRRASGDLVWFVDADCEAEPDALEILVPHLDDPAVGAVSGSYGNAVAHSRLACLIHEEIVERHRRMDREVDFLATFNVLYRRSVLAALDGFDERYLKAQDAELSFRAQEAGHRLHFDIRSIVHHHHEQHWLKYLRTQRQQGYWRALLHLEHPGRGARNSYSSALDHVQPMLAMALLGSLPLVLLPFGWVAPVGLLAALLATQIPMTAALLRRLRAPRYLMFAPMSAIRAVWRGVGLTHGVLTARRRLAALRRKPPPREDPPGDR